MAIAQIKDSTRVEDVVARHVALFHRALGAARSMTTGEGLT